jgi:hypothetical protein
MTSAIYMTSISNSDHDFLSTTVTNIMGFFKLRNDILTHHFMSSGSNFLLGQPRPHIHHHHWCAHYHNPVTPPCKVKFYRFWLRASFFLYLSVHFDLILWNTFVHIQSGVIVCNIPKYCILIRLSIIKPWKFSLARCY